MPHYPRAGLRVKKRLFSIAYMFFLTLVFASVVSVVKGISEERIEANQRVKLQRIILRVLDIPGADAKGPADVERTFETRVKRIDVKGRVVYVGYKGDGRTVEGYAFPISGSGFWGPIYGMMAVNPSADRIMGLAFYKHSETPGLGARITEKWFTSQFKKLRIHPLQGEKKILTLRPVGTARAANELDAITGATGTSRAVEAFMNREIDRFFRELKGPLGKRT